MELHQLHYLRAVVRRGSVTRAAEEVHVAQPSVSKQIRVLERELGVPLLHRVGRRVVPTAAGMVLADLADRIFDDIDRTVAGIAGAESEVAQRLMICATETVADHLVPAALAALRADWPRARISVEMLGTDDSIARVVADAVDLAIVVLPITDTRVEVASLFREPVLLALPPDHRLARSGQIAVAEALSEPSLMVSMRGHGLRAQVDALAASYGAALDARTEMRSQQALLAMVAAGAGIAFAPRIAVAGRSDIVPLPLEPPLEREVGWVRRPGRHLPALADAFLEAVAAAVQAAV